MTFFYFCSTASDWLGRSVSHLDQFALKVLGSADCGGASESIFFSLSRTYPSFGLGKF